MFRSEPLLDQLAIRNMSIAADGSLIAMVLEDGRVAIFSDTGQQMAVIEHEDATGNAAAFSVDDGHVAIAMSDGTIRIHDRISGDLVNVLTSDDNTGFYGVDYSGDDSRIVATTRTGIAKLWDMQSAGVVISSQRRQRENLHQAVPVVVDHLHHAFSRDRRVWEPVTWIHLVLIVHVDRGEGLAA